MYLGEDTSLGHMKETKIINMEHANPHLKEFKSRRRGINKYD